MPQPKKGAPVAKKSMVAKKSAPVKPTVATKGKPVTAAPLKKAPVAKEKYEMAAKDITVLQYLADGYTVKEIGTKMKISHRGIEHSLSKIRESVDVVNTAHLIAYAFREGLIK